MIRPIVHTCANGLPLLILPQHRAEVVSVRVGVETGSAREGEYGGTGISHLLEHFVFKGTEEYSAEQLNEQVAAWGGIWNAYTGADSTIFHIEGCSQQWKNFLHLLIQLTLHPVFPREEWDKERDVIRREMEMCNDDPEGFAYRTLVQTLYKSSPRRFPVIGKRSLFDALTYEDLLRYHRERYVPGNMFICLVGDVEVEQVVSAAEHELASVPPRIYPQPHAPIDTRQWSPRVVREHFAQPASSLMLAWRVPDRNHRDMPALALLSSVLGSGRTAWLYRRFHEDTHAAHEIGAWLMSDSQGEGAFVIEAEVEPSERETLCSSLLDFVRILPKQDFSSALQRALRRTRVHRMKDMLTVASAAEAICSLWVISHNPDAYDEWGDALNRVTARDLARVARRYLTPDSLAQISIDPLGVDPVTDDRTRVISTSSVPQEHLLANGLRCITSVDKSIPMLHTTLAIGAGCRAESSSSAGISAILAECLPKGTVTRTAQQIAEQVENCGASLQASSGNNSILLSLRCLSEDSLSLLEMLADTALHPAFPTGVVAAALADQLAVVQEELQNPAALAQRKLRSLCFGNVSYGLPPSGTPESLTSISQEEVVRLHASLFCSSNAVLSLVGDFEPSVLLPQLEKFFADMPVGKSLQGVATPPMRGGDLCVQTPKPVQQAAMALALPSLPVAHPDYPMLLLLTDWCSDMSGPLYSELRERLGLVYHVSSSVLQGVDTGSLIFELETAPELLDRASTALDKQLQMIATQGMSQDELSRVQATVLSSCLLSDQSPGKLSLSYAVNALLGLGVDYNRLIRDSVQRVTPEQMRQFINSSLGQSTVRARVRALSPKV